MPTPSFTHVKDPQSDLDYLIDWTNWLATDTLTSSTWRVSPGSGMVLHTDSIVTSNKSTVWVRGGRVGTHVLTNRVATTNGREEEVSIVITVQDR
jgi:hypothetical protein